MTAKELLSQSILPVKTSDKGQLVLERMQVYHVSHLPIVNHDKLLGIVSEDDILIHNPDEAIGSYRLMHQQIQCTENDHIFDLMTKIGAFKLTLIPIVSKDNETYLGVVTLEDVLKYFAVQFSFTDPGSILVIETSVHNYLLSEIIRLAEAEDITVLSSFTTSLPNSNKVYITLKLNAQDIFAYKASLERFGYEVYATFSDAEFGDTLQDRYDSLMSYLNL
ncbi:MAG: CBS domain-containing protein [Chitinophagales bacterium]|nr:CBS domain-containing protein [Chitinophagales bacterium]